MAVEFFFFLSGAMTMKHLAGEKRDIPQKMRYATEYTLKKIKRIFPYAVCGTLVDYLWRGYMLKDYSVDVWQKLSALLMELLLLPMAGFVPAKLEYYFNAPLWYVSAMLLVLPLVIYLYLKSEDVFKHYIVWFVPFLVHGWLIQHHGDPWSWGTVTPIGLSGLLVAFSNLLLGFAIYLTAEKLAEKKFGRAARVLFTVAEVGIVVLCFVFAASLPEVYTFEAVIGLLAISLAITLSGVSYTGMLRGKCWEWLGKLSLPIYCLHWCMGQIVWIYFGEYPYPCRVLLTIIGSSALALAVKFGMEALHKIYGRNLLRMMT